MKKELSLILKYLFYVIILTIFSSLLFVMYPFALQGSVDFAEYLVYIFVSVSLYLLPLMAVISLLIIIFREIRLANFTILSFLVYVFLCLFVWLIVIPLFIVFEPARTVSELLIGQHQYLHPFFDGDFLQILINNLKTYEITLNGLLVQMLSDVYLLCRQVIDAVYQGKLGYLLFASIGLALSSLYALKNVSQWKLINVAVIFTIWCVVVFVNIYLFKNSVELYFATELLACIINAVVTFFVLLVGSVSSVKRKKKNQLLGEVE